MKSKKTNLPKYVAASNKSVAIHSFKIEPKAVEETDSADLSNTVCNKKHFN